VKEQMEKRLEELQSELAAGEKLLAELHAKQATVQQTMLRIAGAIQVLQELLGVPAEAASGPGAANGKDPSHP
jgi:uncharacterized coiled-coil protein SlyX